MPELPRYCFLASVLVLPLLSIGCGTTRYTDSPRTATEQLLISDAVDKSVSEIDFRVLSGKKVYLDPQYIDNNPDRGYIVSSLRQHILAHGCYLLDNRDAADYVVEARIGGVGTDKHELLIGVPNIQMPVLIPGYPSSIPEIPFAKRTQQLAVAKLAVYAYNRKTGRPLWQSGVVQNASNSKDLWVFGAGPFRGGTLRKSPQFAGDQIQIPFIGPTESGEELTNQQTVIDVTQQAVWEEPRVIRPNPHQLVGHEQSQTKQNEEKR